MERLEAGAREPEKAAMIVLAAGAGRRFGGVKQLAEVGGRPLLSRVLDAAAGFADAQVVVLGARADRLAAAPIYAGWRVVVAEDWAAGAGASLRAGLRAVPAAELALIVLGDLPWLRREAFERLLSFAARDRETLAARAFDGEVPGHPVLVRGALLRRARSAPDGGLGLLLRDEQVARVPSEGLGVARDVDTPADLAAG